MKRAGLLILVGSLSAGGAAVWGGSPALIGMSLALITGFLGAFALTATCRLVGRMMAAQATPKMGTFVVVLASFVKFPLLVAAWYASRRYGVMAEQAFVAGILVVYAALVGWAATQPVSAPVERNP